MLRIEPPPASTMCLPKIWQPRCVASKFVLTMRVEVFVGDFEIWRRRIDAGGIDERVDAAVLLDGSGEQCFYRFAVGSVDFGKRCFAAQFFDCGDACVTALFAAAGDDDRGAGLRQAVAQLAAEHAGAADDDGDLAVETKQFLQVVGHERLPNRGGLDACKVRWLVT